MEKKKSKTTVLQRFTDKFRKKKRARSTSASRERSSEMSRRPARAHRSPSKSKIAGTSNSPSTSAETKSRMDMMEVTAKGFRKEKKEEKKTSGKKKKDNQPGPTRSPSTIALRRTDSLMEISGNSRNVDKAVKTWIDYFEKPDFKKTIETAFMTIDTIKVDIEKCLVFKKNMDSCQSETIELFDANRVKGNGETDFFYHGSILTMPTVTTRSTILAQLANQEFPTSLESFWLMVAAQKIQRIYVILGEDEFDKGTVSQYFPEDFMEFKTIRVNNRKTLERTNDLPNTQLYYEVVPKDCAEAPFCMIEICDFWPDAKIPTNGYGRIAATAASVFDSDIDLDATSAIVSNYGAGRAGAFFVGALAIEKLRAGDPPNIKEMAYSVRSQRPGAIETLSQYIFTHIIVLHYSLKYVKEATLKTRIEKVISQLEQFGCEKISEDDEDDTKDSNSNTLD